MIETNMTHTEHCSFHPNYIWCKEGCVKLQIVLFPYTPAISCFCCHYLYNLLYHHRHHPHKIDDNNDDDNNNNITATTTATVISFLCSFHTHLISIWR